MSTGDSATIRHPRPSRDNHDEDDDDYSAAYDTSYNILETKFKNFGVRQLMYQSYKRVCRNPSSYRSYRGLSLLQCGV